MRDVNTTLELWAGGRPAWSPRPGETVVGVVMRYDRRAASTGPLVVVTLATAGGQPLCVGLGSPPLLHAFQRLLPQPGDRIALRCVADDAPATEPYFQLLVDRPTGGPERAVMDGDDEEAMQALLSTRPFLADSPDEVWSDLLARP